MRLMTDIKVWCYKCNEYIPRSHAFSNSFECNKCGYEIKVEEVKMKPEIKFPGQDEDYYLNLEEIFKQ